MWRQSHLVHDILHSAHFCFFSGLKSLTILLELMFLQNKRLSPVSSHRQVSTNPRLKRSISDFMDISAFTPVRLLTQENTQNTTFRQKNEHFWFYSCTLQFKMYQALLIRKLFGDKKYFFYSNIIIFTGMIRIEQFVSKLKVIIKLDIL